MIPVPRAEISLIRPDWPAPPNVTALVTTRVGGVSGPPFETFNLAHHTGDDWSVVEENRRVLMRLAGISGPIRWVRQVHGVEVVDATRGDPGRVPEADAVHIRGAGAAAVLTADCLPVLLVDREGREAAVVHAGWRGLARGIVEQALQRMDSPADQVLAWLGPAIGPCHFEVGDDVKTAFPAAYTDSVPEAFRPGRLPGKWMADLYLLARACLNHSGVTDVYGGGLCTVCDETRFFSFRRDGVTGRMAALICLNNRIWNHPYA
ncbi:MAG: peptidoglycan editing factor PgeF [Pseudomonadota bacterium]